MTESEYLAAETKPAALLRFAARRVRPRKVQLMAAGFCRLLEDELPTAIRRGLFVLEEYALGREADKDFAVARESVRAAAECCSAYDRASSATWAVYSAFHPDTVPGAGRAFEFVMRGRTWAKNRHREPRVSAARRQACTVIREIAGNPFRPWTHAPPFAGGGLVQPDGTTVPLNSTVRGLAEAIDVGRYFDRLPILADALEEAGVTDAELLAHCRTGTNHLPGCWAVDVVLGRS